MTDTCAIMIAARDAEVLTRRRIAVEDAMEAERDLIALAECHADVFSPEQTKLLSELLGSVTKARRALEL